MPTSNPNLLNYSKQLAIKLRDPVDEGGADGKVFFAEFRFGYLTRGFGKLLRNLESIGYDVEYIYPQFYTAIDRYFNPSKILINTVPVSVTPVNLNGLKISLLTLINQVDPVFKPYKIIAKGISATGTSLVYRGRIVKINNAFEAFYGLPTEHYNPETLKDTFYFYILAGNIAFLAKNDATAVSLHFLLRTPLPNFTTNSEIDLAIPREFEDMFLSLAALEASLDVGDQGKVNLYRSEINNELQMLGVGEKVKAAKEKVDPIE